MDEQKINRIKQRASEGDPKAAYYYAECLEDGDGVRQNLQESFKFYLFAANQGIRRAQRKLGIEALTSGNIYDWYKYLISSPRNNQYVKRRAMYELGYFYKMNNQLSEAFQLFLDAARLEETDAEYEVAKAYKDGLGVVKDSKEAFNWYKKAADNGCVDAKLWMGIYFETGLDGVVDKNKEEANRLYEEIQDENQVAKYNLAMNIKNGEGCNTDLKKAFQLLIDLSEDGFQNASKVLGDAINTGDINDWYKKLEKEGDVEAIFQLAELDHNKGVPYDQEPCYSRYITAANKGHAKALYIVAQIYKSNGNVWKYLRYLHRSADKGFADAEFDYGLYLRDKEGRTEEEARLSFRYLLRAANNEYVEAMFAVGYAYVKGIGVEENGKESVNWFRMYIKKEGNATKIAYSNIGLEYFYGKRNLEKNAKEAFKAFYKASELGFARAQYYMGLFYDNGYDVVKQDHKKAFSYYKQALSQGNIFLEYDQCCYYLANDLKNGQGTDIDLSEAFQWYQSAATKGEKRALDELGVSCKTGDIKDWLIKLDDQGNNPDAMVLLAQILMDESDEKYTGNNLHEAFSLLLKASETGNETAQSMMGVSYESKDIKDWYEQLSKEGNAKVKFQLAEMLREQENSNISEKCLQLYQSASNDGCGEASYRLACYYKDNDHQNIDLYAKYLKMSATEKFPQGMYEYACFIYDSNCENANIILQQAADLGLKEAQIRFGQILYSGNDALSKDYKKAYEYLKMGASEDDNDENYPCGVNPYALNYGFWLYELYDNGDSYAGTLYVLQPEFRTEQLDADVLKEVIFYLGNIAANNSNKDIEKTLIWAFEQLCETTGNLDEVFSYLQDYEELIKQYNMFDESDVLKKYYTDECVDQFLNTYLGDSANWYYDENGHTIYKVPDLSQTVPDIEVNDDEKDFWYDCALTFDLSEKYAKSIFIYEYAALLGSRKAWYTLGNMAQEESQYFLEIIDNY